MRPIVAAIAEAFVPSPLASGPRILHHGTPDDSGLPETVCPECNLRHFGALAPTGKCQQVPRIFDELATYRNHFGLLSEDRHPGTGVLRCHLPQTYAMAAIVSTAKRLSRPWEAAWRGD